MNLIPLFMNPDCTCDFSAYINGCLDDQLLEIAVPVAALPFSRGLYQWEIADVSLPAGTAAGPLPWVRLAFGCWQQ